MKTALAVGVLTMASTVGAQNCPDGYTERSRTKTLLTCEKNLPVIRPCAFAMPGESERVAEKIAELRRKRARYTGQLEFLQSNAAGLVTAARDIAGARAEAITECELNALEIISTALGEMGGRGLIRTNALRQSLNLVALSSAQIKSVGVAIEAGHDSREAVKKAADALLDVEKLLRAGQVNMPPAQFAAMQKGIQATYKLFLATDRIAQASNDQLGWNLYLQSLDDVIAAGAQFHAGLNIAQRTAHIIDGEVAQWQLGRARDVVNDAFVSNSRAVRYYHQRLQDSDPLLQFYEERLSCLGK